MSSYEMITGPFEGMIVEEGHQFLDIPFDQLDADMQDRVRMYAEDHDITDMEDAKERYENSWESVETDEPVGCTTGLRWMAQGLNAGSNK